MEADRKTLREVQVDAERAAIKRTLEAVGWNVRVAASELGVSRTHLHRLIDKHGLTRPPATPLPDETPGASPRQATNSCP